jgi:hypothetical protein
MDETTPSLGITRSSMAMACVHLRPPKEVTTRFVNRTLLLRPAPESARTSIHTQT